MTNSVATMLSNNRLAKFEAQKAALHDAQADAVIEFAKRVRDWPALEQAVDLKIADQTEFVQWWAEHVRKGRPKSNADSALLSVDQAEELTGIAQPQVSKWAKRLKDIGKYRAALFGAAYKAAMAAVLAESQLIQQSLSNEHYTPDKYLDAVRNVLGAIDLDPASCQEANQIVKATAFFSADDNGLRQEWRGRVWLNPPYGGSAGQFIAKLSREYCDGNVSAAVALVNAHCTDTDWFQPLWDGCLCFTNHRINFYGDDTRSGSTHGSVFVYFGPSNGEFVKHFSQFGAVVARMGDDASA